MITLTVLLVLIALLLTIASAAGYSPLWPPVFVIVVILLLDRWPK